MPRRVHVDRLSAGRLTLSPAEAHHVRDVLRLTAGNALELFDDIGRTAFATIVSVAPDGVAVEVPLVEPPTPPAVRLTVAAAVPKGDRADWLVEKLSELGVDRFTPIVAERSVVVPAGRNKIERWARLAVESAKQCRRAGVMAVDAVTPAAEVIGRTAGWLLSTEGDVQPIASLAVPATLTVVIGPEGGWTADELARSAAAGWQRVGLTRTVLRIETAAIAVAAVVGCSAAGPGQANSSNSAMLHSPLVGPT